MRIVVAPDKFAGTLTAVQAAEAVIAGWKRAVPADELVAVPLSDGGTGFVQVLAGALCGEADVRVAPVTGPAGEPVPASWLLAGGTAYVEVAEACGLHLVPAPERDAQAATSYGVGELIAAAIEAGARKIVLGLGGTATTDGGAGMLAALGAGPNELLAHGGGGLAGLTEVDLAPAKAKVEGVELVAATDVDHPLLGLRGAAAVFGPQKGATPDDVQRLDAALTNWANLAEGIAPDAGRMRKRISDVPGAGAGGGLGYGLMLLGAVRVSGIAAVLDAVGLEGRIAGADLVVTGEGSFDFQSLHGKVVSGVAQAAQAAARPCVVVAGRVEVGRRELATAGIDAAYSVAEFAGSPAASMAQPFEHLSGLAERVARTWSRNV